MKAYEGGAVWLHSFLTSALDGDEWSTSRRGRFTPGEIALVTIEWKAGWATMPVWTFCRTAKSVSFPRRFLGHPAHSLVTIQTELSWPRTSKALLNLLK